MKKLIRDTEMILKFARFVIVIQNNGLINIELIDNAWRAEQNLPYAPIIAVVGNTGILLEIGYGRARPYNQVESYTSKEPGDIRKRWCIKPRRRRLGKLFLSEIQIVYPLICECITKIVRERTETWKNDLWWVGGRAKYVARGIRFTVSKSDEWFYRQLLLENIRHLESRSIFQTHCKCVHFWVGHYKRFYSKKMLQKFSGTQKLTEMLGHYGNPIYQASLLYLLDGYPRAQELFMHIARTFVWTNEIEIRRIYNLLREPNVSLPAMKDTRIYIPIKRQPRYHGKDCLTVEIFLEDKFLA